MLKTIIFHRPPAHYRLDVFRRIYEKTGAVFCFGKKGAKHMFLSRVEPDFHHIRVRDFYPYPRKNTLVFYNIFPALFKVKPDLIVTEFALANLSNYLLLLLRRIFGYRLILWSHGYDRRKGFFPERSYADKIRRFWANKADAVIFYAEKDRRLFLPHVRDKAKLFVAQNTLDTEKLTRLREQFESHGKEKLKNQMGFSEKYHLIFIGRLLAEKEPERLIRVFEEIAGRLGSVKLHIVGEGPLLTKLKKMAQGLNIKFWNSVTDDIKTGKLLYCSDLMVMPGYLGLSIVHAFCFDTPVVSQKTGPKGPFHSPEIEYLINGKTGLLVEYGQNEKMAAKICDYLQNPAQQSEFRAQIRNMLVHTCAVDKMIIGFANALNYAGTDLKNKKKHR